MKFKRFVYILLILLTSFVYMNSVSATTAKVCKYSKKSDYDVYLYQTVNGNHYAYKMSSDGNKHKIYNASLKSNISNFSNCPEYMHIENENKNVFYFDDKQEHTLLWVSNSYNNVNYNDKSYTSWECSYDNVVVKQNKKGLISYTIDGKYSTNNYLQFYDYSFNSGTCPGYFASKAYQTDSSKLFFYKDESAVKSVNNGKTTGYTAAKDNSTNNNNNNNNDLNSSGSSSSGSGLGVGGYCVYKNFGQCVDDDGDINGDCGAFSNNSSGKKSSYFSRAKYAIFKYPTTNNDYFESVYLPKYTISSKNTYVIDSNISSKVVSDFNSFDGSFDKLSSMVQNYVEFSKNEISTLNSYNVSPSTDEKGCPLWFSNIDGASGYDYEDSIYWYQLYDTNPENNKNTENPDVVSSGVVVDAGEGPYYCIYDGSYGSVNTKTGTLALFFDTEKSRLKLLSYDFSTAYLNSKCSLDDCSTVDGVKFVGYGGYESNDGSFQSNFVAATTATCPKQINYNYNKGVLTICKDESDECINGGGGILGNINRFSNYYDNGSGGNIIDITSCDDLISDDLRKILNKYFLAFRIIVPLLVLALGIIDFAKTVFVSKEDDMKKTQQTFIKRLIVAVAIFFIPTFVNLLLDVANTVWGWNTGTCEIEKIDE